MTEDDQPGPELLEAEFFDDELIVVVYRLRNRDSKRNARIRFCTLIDRAGRIDVYSNGQI